MPRQTKFFFDNYIDLNILADSDVSSEQASFPVTNAYNTNRRSKVWRSNGYFKITDDNNQLVFRDSNGGSDLTAVVATGEYNSTTAFMTALDSALEAVGGFNYTVTQNDQKKFVIGSSNSYFELRCADANSTIIDVIGFNNVNLSDATSYEADEVRVNTSEWVLWDMGIASTPNAFAMTGPRNSFLKFSPSSTITLKGNFTNPESWDNPPFEEVLEFDDEVMALISETQFYEEGLRFWRLEFEDIDNPFGYIEVGAFFLGRWYSPDNGSPQFPLNSSFIDRTETLISEGGQSFSDILPKSQNYSLSYQGLKKTDIEDVEFWFNKIGTGKPFFISLDTDEAFSSMYQRKLKFVKFDGAPRWALNTPNNFSLEMVVREEL